MKKIIAMLLALVMVFALVACGDKTVDDEKTPDESPKVSDTTPVENDDPVQPSDVVEEPNPTVDYDNPIKVGHLADLTGNEKSTGVLGEKAVNLAVKLINENGGIAGRALEVITLDCQSDASIAATNVRTLVEEHEVVAIVGPTQMGHKQAVAPVAAEYEVPVMPYNGTPVFLTKKNEYFMSTGGGTAQMPTAMADYLYNDLNLRTIYCITQEGTAGDNYVGPLKANFEAMGGKVIEDIRIAGDDMDVSQELLRVTEDADALIGWLSGTQGVNLWTNWYDLKICDKMPLYGAVHGGFTDYFIWKQLNNSRPEVVAEAMEQGVFAPINWAASIDNDTNKALCEAWAAEFGEPAPGSNLPGAGYTSLMLIKNAIESIDGEITGEAVYTALQNAECDGAEGHTTFGGGKVAIKDVHIVKVVAQDGGNFNYEIIKTYPDVPVDGLTAG